MRRVLGSQPRITSTRRRISSHRWTDVPWRLRPVNLPENRDGIFIMPKLHSVNLQSPLDHPEYVDLDCCGQIAALVHLSRTKRLRSKCDCPHLINVVVESAWRVLFGPPRVFVDFLEDRCPPILRIVSRAALLDFESPTAIMASAEASSRTLPEQPFLRVARLTSLIPWLGSIGRRQRPV